MALPRPGRPGIRTIFPLALILAVAVPIAAAIDLRAGNFILTDRTADPFGFGDSRGTIMLGDPTSAIPIRLLASPQGFVDPVTSIALADGRIIVVDSNADPFDNGRAQGALFAVDPNDQLPGKAALFAFNPQWEAPVDILQEASGNLLVLDADADPLGSGDRPGALYRVGLDVPVVNLIAASTLFSEPRSMVYDRDGAVLIWDVRADPLGIGGAPGALFRVDLTTGDVSVVFSIRGFVTPWAVALDKNGDYLIVDRNANPNEYPGAPGCVFRVERGSLVLTPVIAPLDFAEPFDLLVDPSGSVWVVDNQANPFNYPTAVGALFQCDPVTGQITNTLGSGFLRAFVGISEVAGTALDSSLVRWEDVDGAPLQPGDRMRVRARIRNTGSLPGRPVQLAHSVGTGWEYWIGSDSASTGSFSYDPTTRIVRWAGDVDAQAEADVSYEIKLRNSVAAGASVTERITLKVARTEVDFTLSEVVARRSTPGRVVWADYEPGGSSTIGNIWEMPSGAVRPSRIFSGPPLVQPTDLCFLPDGRLAVLDRRSQPRGPDLPSGGIFLIDPSNGRVDTLFAVADHPELRTPLGLAAGKLNELLLIDKDANPSGHPGQPGALYSVDVRTGELNLIVSSPQFREPIDATLETTGRILIVDYEADPFNQDPRGGALFEYDRDRGLILILRVPAGKFVDPVAVVEGSDRRIFVADLSADPLGLHRNTGAVYEIRRDSNDLFLTAAADSMLVDPVDVYPQRDGTLMIMDREANPLGLPPRDRGAVFKGRPGLDDLTLVTADPLLYGPEAVAGFEEGSLALSTFTVLDTNGPPTGAGDTLRYEALIRNATKIPIPEAMATITISPGVELLSGTGPGGVVVDPPIRAVSWLGGVDAGDTVRVVALARVSPGHSFGDPITGLLRLSGPPGLPPIAATIKVVGPLGTGAMVLVDANADPGHTGDRDGALFLLDTNLDRFDQLLQADSNWVDPTAVVELDSGRLLIADPRGLDPGQVLTVDYLRGTSVPYVTDERLGNPVDLYWTPARDLLVVDTDAELQAGGPPRPAIFIKRHDSPILSLFSADTTLKIPSQITEDDAGRFWVVDRSVDPNGPDGPGRGAMLQVDPATGGVVRTLQFVDFRAPVGIVNWPGEGLLVVDEAVHSVTGGQGAVFLIDPDLNTLRFLVADRRFRLPRSATFAPSGELWIVDLVARDETKPGNPRTVFRWDPESGRVDAVAASDQYVTPLKLYSFPGPNPRLTSYTVEDVNGPPLQPADEILVTVRAENLGPVATLSAAYLDSLPPSATLDRLSLRADAGIIQTAGNANNISWVVDLPPGASYEASYRAHLRTTVQQGALLSFRSHLRSVEGVHRSRAVSLRLPIFFEDGCFYVADADADPNRFGGNPGNVFKVSLTTPLPTAMVVTDSTSQPVSCVSLPTVPPQLLIVDAVANPNRYPIPAQGCLWRWEPATSDVSIAAASPLFRQPLAAVVMSDRELLVLDGTADPYGGAPGNIHGGVFHVQMPDGVVTPFATDTVFVSPRDMILDGRGGAFIIDQDADPGRFGMRNGAVFRLDLLQRTISPYAASADFRGPVAGAVGLDGMLYIADRDVQPFQGSQARGIIFKVDSFGNVSIFGASRTFRALVDLQFDSVGRLLVSDAEADPYRLGTAQGAIFRFDREEFRVVVAGGQLKNPGGFFLRETLTPIDLTALEATPSAGGIRISWQVPEANFDGFLVLRAPGEDADESAYEVLNPSEPIPGRGPWQYDDLLVEPGETYSYKIGALLPGGGMSVYGPAVATAPVRLKFALFPGAPNPVRDATTLRFDLPRSGQVKMRIYDPAGRRVRVLLDRVLPAGHQTIVWDGRNDDGRPVASGIFYVRLESRGEMATRTLTLLR
jgi:hypothetical protein